MVGDTGNSGPEGGARGFDSYAMQLGDLMRGERATMGKSLLDVQRDLRIKATYIAAIENCDISAFPTQGFIAGHVRSYARYLGLNPDRTFEQFCRETNYEGVHGKNAASLVPSDTPKQKFKVAASGGIADPLFANARTTFVPAQSGFLSEVSASGIGSILILIALIAGIGYGAWAILQDIQRVEFVPVNQTPGVSSDIAGLGDPILTEDAAFGPELAENMNSSLERLYRPQELEVPVLTARDGPISSLDPDSIGALVPNTGERLATMGATDPVENNPVISEDTSRRVAIIASNPAWIRVSGTDGTVIFEKILDAGEAYELPDNGAPLELRAGNAGAVFVNVGDQIFGPIGGSGAVVRNISLQAEDVATAYPGVTNFEELGLPQPSVITQNLAGN